MYINNNLLINYSLMPALKQDMDFGGDEGN